MRFLAQTKVRREKERGRKRKGKEEEGKEKGKGKGKLEGKLWQKRKNRKRPSRESNPGPQQTRLMLYHWATETSNITSQFVWYFIHRFLLFQIVQCRIILAKKTVCWIGWLIRQDPLEAILVIFGHGALIFFCLKALGKIWKMTQLLCACAVVITLEKQKCRKWGPLSVEFNFFY